MCPASWNVRFTLCTMPVNTDQPSISVVLGKKTTCSKNRSERKMNVGVITGFQGRVKKELAFNKHLFYDV